MSKRFLIPLVPALTAAAFGASPALADAPTAISANWAGYEAVPAYSSSGFSGVSGSWVQPSANCSNASGTYAAFWVGLGGGSGQSQGLEQVGTQADCTGSGSPSYYAWYELVPSAPVALSMQINPGDQMNAAVHVNGSSVTVSITDQTTGASVNRTLQMSNPDTSSAEWIAEAPSSCQGGAGGQCTPLPLTNFGTVNFTNATATVNGYTGGINDANWSAESLALDPSQGGYGYGYGPTESVSATGSTAGAQPSSLSSGGGSFSVSYSANGIDPNASSGGGSTSSSGGSSGYGYGGSGYGYGGSSDPYGYGGDPYGGSGGGYGYGYGSADPYGSNNGLPGIISSLLGL
jgi:hypothetical protein